MKDRIRNLLARSLDEDLNREEAEVLKQALAASGELREERRQLLRLRQSVASTRTASFGPLFAERLMERIRAIRRAESQAEAFPAVLANAFRRVATVGAAVAVGLVIYNSAKTEDISLAAAFGVPEVDIETITEPPVETIWEEPL